MFATIVIYLFAVFIFSMLALFVWAISTDERNTKACETLRALRQAMRK